MDMGSFLRRTNKTSWTNEELLIVDVLFDSSDTFESLLKENYAGWHNLPYSHSLEDDSLRDMLNELIHNGILTSSTAEHGNKTFYALTEAGGKLWEAERAPDWERYCTDSSKVGENNRWMLSVESPSMMTVKSFVECAKSCRLYEFKQEEIRTITLRDEKLSTIYWRTFLTICSIFVPTHPLPEINKVDWKEYEHKRTWWRSLTELAKFQRI